MAGESGEMPTVRPSEGPSPKAISQKQRYQKDRSIVGTISKRYQGKQLSQAEEIGLRTDLTERLKLTGFSNYPQLERLGLESLIGTWSAQKGKEMDEFSKNWSEEKWKKEHPYIKFKGIQMGSFTSDDAGMVGGSVKGFERYIGRDDPVAVLMGIDKEEDAVGLAKTLGGKINIALSDGVSGTVMGEIASRVSVDASLDQLATNPASMDTLKTAFNVLQEEDVPSMVTEVLQETRRQRKQEKDPIKGRTLSLWTQKLENYRDKDALTAATLAVAQYDPKTGDISFGVKGDSSVVVFKHDGTFTEYKSPKRPYGVPQIQYFSNPNHSYASTGGGEVIEHLQLEPQDVVMLCSDGVPDGSYGKQNNIFQDLNDALVEYRSTRASNPNPRGEFQVIHFLKDEIAQHGLSDDVSVVAIEHR